MLHTMEQSYKQLKMALEKPTHLPRALFLHFFKVGSDSPLIIGTDSFTFFCR